MQDFSTKDFSTKYELVITIGSEVKEFMVEKFGVENSRVNA